VNVTGLIEVVHLVMRSRGRHESEMAANDERDTDSDGQKLTEKVVN